MSISHKRLQIVLDFSQNISEWNFQFWIIVVLGSLFFPDFKRCRFIFLAAVCSCCSLKYISSACTRPFTIVERRKKKVEFRVCILRINNCRKKSSCSTAVWLMSKGTETNLALSSRLFLVSLRRGFVSSFSCHKKRTYISYDNIIVIVLVLVWLTFISLYLILWP